mmetsp:Transcript_30708/g.57493  ORF Transcript_30708/g.57493 Transcript_30708/m.57493 type:complete len:230 (+) Transcript_30708:230-919(+)|eukprot:CAMPEP_0178761862 /NCGR_PEP_ID=MMETSP0744-20121128/16235_1 /TAXON_ID=913974 /ORGANISM="Nitzschia punctata, Strain CCMP561" /LENGTH=229 /DNA_ID=CAMNT_0020416501 /DNA_START=176 /DNA_END=865 /DNA_ORIENTATION=+
METSTTESTAKHSDEQRDTNNRTSTTNKECEDHDFGNYALTTSLEQGRLEGKQAGLEAGYQEGRILGQTKGVDFGMEVGFAMGLAHAVEQQLPSMENNNDKEDDKVHRIRKSVDDLKRAIEEFPNLQQELFHYHDNHDTAFSVNNSPIDVREKLQRIRARSKVLTAKLGIPHHSLKQVLQHHALPQNGNDKHSSASNQMQDDKHKRDGTSNNHDKSTSPAATGTENNEW